MVRTIIVIFLFYFVTIIGCSDDNPSSPNNPTTGEVLLATVSGDSIAITSGANSRSLSITSGTLNFTDRDSARIFFFFSGENNSVAQPLQIYWVNDTTNVYLFNDTLYPAPAEQYINVTVPSPGVNQSFRYRISTLSVPGFSYFKFHDLNIYKK
jgi:hypothetical protein